MYISNKKLSIYQCIWLPNSPNEKFSVVNYFSIFLFALKHLDKHGNLVTLGQACFSSTNKIYLSGVVVKMKLVK